MNSKAKHFKACLTDPERRKAYKGAVTRDHYGREIPRHGHGTANLPFHMASTSRITEEMMRLFDRVADPSLLVRRLNVTACHVVPESMGRKVEVPDQLDLFTDLEALDRQRQREEEELERERRRQKAILSIQKRYGKNALLKGMDLEEGATTRDRNGQIGGHKA